MVKYPARKLSALEYFDRQSAVLSNNEKKEGPNGTMMSYECHVTNQPRENS